MPPSVTNGRCIARHCKVTGTRRWQRSTRCCVTISRSPRLFANWYDRAVLLYLQGAHGQRGCFLISTALTELVLDEDVRAFAAEALNAFEAAFAACIRAARERGELPPDTDPTALARVASGILYALSIRARTGATRDGLNAIIAAGIATLFPATGDQIRQRAPRRGRAAR